MRHIRQNEENVRAELVGSTVVRRHAGLLAALIVTVAANILLILLITAAFLSFNLPVNGSIAAALVPGMTIAGMTAFYQRSIRR